MKKCPFCAEPIQDEAIVCRYCGRDLKGSVPRLTIDSAFLPGRRRGPLVEPLGYVYLGVVIVFYLILDGTGGMITFAVTNAATVGIGILLIRETDKKKLGFLIAGVSALCVLIGAIGAVSRYEAGQQAEQDRQRRAAQEEKQRQAERAESQRQVIDARRAAAKKEEDERLTRIREQKPQIYQDGVDRLSAGDYEQALALFKQVALVDPSYMELPDKVQLAEKGVQQAQEAKRAENARVATEAREKAALLSKAQNSVGLTAKVSFNGIQFSITNESAQRWTRVELEINPGGLFSSKGYTYKVASIEPQTTITVGAMEFANSDGERFNPFQKKPQKLIISATLPDGRSEIWIGGWE